MKWVTRRGILVNPAATAWLVRRFVDLEAVFPFVDPDQVADVERREGAVGFDAPGVCYPHDALYAGLLAEAEPSQTGRSARGGSS